MAEKPKQYLRMTGIGKQMIEVEECDSTTSAVHLRCKTWMHLDREGMQILIKGLTHILDSHMKEQES